ncbi:MAG TPA: PIN domain-containing protein [Ktedonobacterales bacterium]|nr:PIN domain-containing protein [Ktedonobacterales bacterium]
MGSLVTPKGALVYLDTNCIIYSGERIAPYYGLLLPIWQGANRGNWALLTSELTLMEALVGPLKAGNAKLEADYRNLLIGASDVRSMAITQPILERVARLRATTNLKTPDAIHAATALEAGATLFLTNDPAFRRVPSLAVTVLSDLITP